VTPTVRSQTDCEFLLSVLDDESWHSTSELLRRSIEDRGFGMTVHSRISDLRSKGFAIEHRQVKGERAAAHEYRLLGDSASEPLVDIASPLEERDLDELPLFVLGEAA
jgi:hypothetical protein